MARLDPTLDLVFKLLLTHEPRLLRDMLQGILARPIRRIDLIDPEVRGAQIGDRHVIFDVRARLDGGARADLEMQRRILPTQGSRFVYYSTRDYSDQLCRGDSFHLLTPTIGIIWLVEPLFVELRRLHSVFELRERDTGVRFTDQLSIHLLQLPYLVPSQATDHTSTVERWARFFAAKDDATFAQLASEHPIMSLATQTLDKLSQDPDVRRRARYREDELKLYEIALAANRAAGRAAGVAEGRAAGMAEGRAAGMAEGRAAGVAEGRAAGVAEGEARGKAGLLLKLLGRRFGPVSEAFRARVYDATPEQLDAWGEKILSVSAIDEVFES